MDPSRTQASPGVWGWGRTGPTRGQAFVSLAGLYFIGGLSLFAGLGTLNSELANHTYSRVAPAPGEVPVALVLILIGMALIIAATALSVKWLSRKAAATVGRNE